MTSTSTQTDLASNISLPSGTETEVPFQIVARDSSSRALAIPNTSRRSHESIRNDTIARPFGLLRDQLRRRRLPIQDLEMQQGTLREQRCRLRARLVEAIFLFDQKQLMKWPGIEAYLDHVEEKLDETERTRFSGMCSALRLTDGNDRVEDGIEIIIQVCDAVRKFKMDDCSIDELLRDISTDSETTFGVELKKLNRQAVFTAAALLTAIVAPSPVMENEFRIESTAHENAALSRPLETAARPIARMFATFGTFFPRPATQSTSNPSDSSNEHLYSSSLNYSCLRTIGKVNIQWTKVLSEHLLFNPHSRTLCVYSLPSFCALTILMEENDFQSSVMNKVLLNYYPKAEKGSAGGSHILSLLKREVMLSYRLIFGQDSESRKHFHSVEARILCEQSPSGRYDCLLDTLCGTNSGKKLDLLPKTLWPESCRSYDGKLLEQDVYSSTIDFPVLGERLAKIQAYNLRQKPNRIRDLWRDRRNPLQWYTFWAVIIFGGISLVLQIIATLLGVVQTYAAFMQISAQ